MPEIIPNLHPLFVHFPIALLSVSAFLHLATKAMQGKPYYAHPCAILAHTTLWLAALTALPAVLFGWQAFNSVNHDDAGHTVMLTHRAWALATFAVIAVVAAWDVWRNKVDIAPKWSFSLAVLVAWVMLSITAWHGGELVYRHGLGVMSLPAAAEDLHPHGATSEPHEHADHSH